MAIVQVENQMEHTSRLLLVDDEIEFLEILQRRLTRRGHQVTLCQGQYDAQRAMASACFDAVITDRSLKAGDGLELSREIRRQNAELPIIVMSGYSSDFARRQAFDAGATEYLVKPFSLNELESAVERLFLDRRDATMVAVAGR